MSEEEKKAVEEIDDILHYCNGLNCDLEDYDSYHFNRTELDKLSIVLNLIENQQREIKTIYKELKLKDKVIDEMAVNISEAETFIAQNYGIYTEFDKADKEYIIKAFTNKVKGDKE